MATEFYLVKPNIKEVLHLGKGSFIGSVFPDIMHVFKIPNWRPRNFFDRADEFSKVEWDFIENWAKDDSVVLQRDDTVDWSFWSDKGDCSDMDYTYLMDCYKRG